MWSMAIPSFSTSTLKVESNLDMGAYLLKTDHIAESTAAHGIIGDSTVGGTLSLTPTTLTAGTTYTAFTKAAEQTHNAASDKIVAIVRVPDTISSTSVVTVTADIKVTSGTCYIEYAMVAYPNDALGSTVGSVAALGGYIGSSPNSVSHNTSTYTSKSFNPHVLPGCAMMITLFSNSTEVASIRNIVVSYNATKDTGAWSGS